MHVSDITCVVRASFIQLTCLHLTHCCCLSSEWWVVLTCALLPRRVRRSCRSCWGIFWAFLKKWHRFAVISHCIFTCNVMKKRIYIALHSHLQDTDTEALNVTYALIHHWNRRPIVTHRRKTHQSRHEVMPINYFNATVVSNLVNISSPSELLHRGTVCLLITTLLRA